jgi:hypothetical protein
MEVTAAARIRAQERGEMGYSGAEPNKDADRALKYPRGGVERPDSRRFGRRLECTKNFGFHANEWEFKGETAQMEEIGGGDHGGVV